MIDRKALADAVRAIRKREVRGPGDPGLDATDAHAASILDEVIGLIEQAAAPDGLDGGVERIAAALPPGGLTLAFGGTALEAAQALYDAGLRAAPDGLDGLRLARAMRAAYLTTHGAGNTTLTGTDVRYAETIAAEYARLVTPSHPATSEETP